MVPSVLIMKTGKTWIVLLILKRKIILKLSVQSASIIVNSYSAQYLTNILFYRICYLYYSYVQFLCICNNPDFYYIQLVYEKEIDFDSRFDIYYALAGIYFFAENVFRD